MAEHEEVEESGIDWSFAVLLLCGILAAIWAAMAAAKAFERRTSEVGCFSRVLASRFPFAEYSPLEKYIAAKPPDRKVAIMQARALAYLLVQENTDPKTRQLGTLCLDGYAGVGKWWQELRAMSLIRGMDLDGTWWSFMEDVARDGYRGWYGDFPWSRYRCATTYYTRFSMANVIGHDASLVPVGEPIGSLVLLGPKDCRPRRLGR